MRYGNIRIKLIAVSNKSSRASFFPCLLVKSLFNWYPRVRDKKGTEGLKWYKNMMRGERDHGSQNARKPNRIIIKFIDLFLTISQTVKITATLPAQKSAGLPVTDTITSP